MEIRVAFQFLVGLMMILTIVLATVVITISIIKGNEAFQVSDCIPVGYVTEKTPSFSSDEQECGFRDVSGGFKQVYCESDDECMDAPSNKCCNESATILGGKCCKLCVKLSYVTSDNIQLYSSQQQCGMKNGQPVFCRLEESCMNNITNMCCPTQGPAEIFEGYCCKKVI